MRLLLRRRSAKPKARHSLARRILRLAAILLIGVIGTTVVLVLPWRWLAPPTTAFILRERLISEEPVHYRWVRWEEIAPALAISAVAAEDQKFPDHFGFDWEAIENAVEQNSEGGRVRGGSTISQQLAKNLFLWPGQNWIRKGAEAWFTVWLELLWPKQRIIEVYLNVAEFGPGIFGVGVASEYLLAKSPSELTARDAAILVAVLPSPKRMSAADPSEYVRERARQIQEAVDQLGGTRYLSGMWPAATDN